MSKVLEVAKLVLKEEETPFVLEDSGDALIADLEGDHGTWTSEINVIDVPEVANMPGSGFGLVAVISFCDVEVPEARRAAVGELLNRANYAGIMVGHFELDYDGGEVRFRTSLAYSKAEEVTTGLMRNLILENWAEVDTLLPALRAVVKGSEALAALDALVTQ
jgi:hypothetical protein